MKFILEWFGLTLRISLRKKNNGIELDCCEWAWNLKKNLFLAYWYLNVTRKNKTKNSTIYSNSDYHYTKFFSNFRWVLYWHLAIFWRICVLWCQWISDESIGMNAILKYVDCFPEPLLNRPVVLNGFGDILYTWETFKKVWIR